MGRGGHIFADDDTLLTVEWRQRRLPRLTSAATALETLCCRPSEEVKRPPGGPLFFFVSFGIPKKKKGKKAPLFLILFIFLLENKKYIYIFFK